MGEFDYIVVGAGTAGCVVAGRLSEDPACRVLVVEAGPERAPAISSDPVRWRTLVGSPADWRHQTVPQPGLNGRPQPYPQGRMPGGSGSMNGMTYVRGHPSDFDAWARGGATGWGYADCQPFFRRLENCVDDPHPSLGHDGPVQVVSARRGGHPVSEAFLSACAAAGHRHCENFNRPAPDAMLGAGWLQLNIADGVRCGPAQAYLTPALARPNVTLAADAHATRLLFEGRRCGGVEYTQRGATQTARAAGEVVVAAGAVQSPRLLLLSGVGPADHLRAVGVAVRADLPGVGANFHDHARIEVVYHRARPAPVPSQVSDAETSLFFARGPSADRPDLQLVFCPMPPDWDTRSEPSGFAAYVVLLRPASTGTVRLASGDPAAASVIDPGLLTAPEDADGLLAGLREARRLFATPPLSGWVGGERSPGRDAGDALATVHAKAVSQWHIAGSCRMGADAMAVVDPRLRVHGVEGLRVADASVMPRVVSGNCQAAVMMIGERAAEFIRPAPRAVGDNPAR